MFADLLHASASLLHDISVQVQDASRRCPGVCSPGFPKSSVPSTSPVPQQRLPAWRRGLVALSRTVNAAFAA